MEQRLRANERLLALLLAALFAGVVVAAVVVNARSDGDRVETVDSIPASEQSYVHVIAPAGGCWQLSLGESDSSPGTRVEQGCGPMAVPIAASEGLVSLGRRPQDWWDLGMRVEVNGVVVRDIKPAPYVALTVHWADRLPKKTIVARLMAPDTGCWTATVENEIEEGCGSKDLSLDVEGDVNVVFERDPPAAWTWCLVLEVDDRIVQTRGPDSNPAYPLGFWYGPAPPWGYGGDVEVEPVTC